MLEKELDVFREAGKTSYELIGVVVSYFEVHANTYHHPQENLVFLKLAQRNPDTVTVFGELEGEHRKAAERLQKVSKALEQVLTEREIPRSALDEIIRDFIEKERHHMVLEEKYFFPAAQNALLPEDWDEIANSMTGPQDPLFSDCVEARFEIVRRHILELEDEAEAARHQNSQSFLSV